MNEQKNGVMFDMGEGADRRKANERIAEGLSAAQAPLGDDAWMRERDAEIQRRQAERDARVAPAGALNLPPLLDERRLRWKIPNEAFNTQATYERVFLWQIGPGEPRDDKASSGGLITLADSGKDRVKNEAPRGIIISAGLIAMDHLLSHGYAIGHIVNFVKLAPWRLIVNNIMGKEDHVLVMDVANLIGSEDLRKALAAGLVRYQENVTIDGVRHRYVDEKGNDWLPTKPWTPEDYR